MKKLKLLLWISLVCIDLSLSAQTTGSIPEKIPSQYIVNVPNELDTFILNNRKNANSELFKDFAEMAIYRKKAMLLNGNVYYTYPFYEAYLNDILQRLLDASDLENKSRFKVYLKNDASYNAFAMPDGTVLITMGLLASCLNESALACIMAHEIGHVKYRDAYKDYKKNISIDWRNITSKEYNKIISNLKYSRAAEIRADSFGFHLAMKAGFDIKQGFSNYNYIYRLELRQKMYKAAQNKTALSKDIRYKPLTEIAEEIAMDDEDSDNTKSKNSDDDYDEETSDSENKRDKKLSTHPEAVDRVIILKQFIEDFYQENITNYPLKAVNLATFNELQEVAKKEVLRILLQDHEYNECTENAFLMILKDTNDQVAIYYLLESMRRNTVLDNTAIRAGFLSKGLEKVIKKKKSILHQPLYLIPDSTLLLSYQGITYFDSIYEFENNKSAFIYFSKKADARLNPEINLTRGLFNKSNNLAKADSLLKFYINDPKAKFKRYAQSYMDGSLYTTLEKNNHDIIVCSDLSVYTGTKTSFKREYVITDSATTHFERDFMKFNKRKPVGADIYFQKNQPNLDFAYLYNLNLILYSTYYMITDAKDFKTEVVESNEDDEEDTVLTTKVSKKKKKEPEGSTYTSYLYQLEPETWSFIQQNDIRSVSGFYISRLYDKKKLNNDIVNNAIGLFIPGAILFRPKLGSRAIRNRFTYLSFNTSTSDKPILYQQEEGKDYFQRMDYVNALYFKIKMTTKR